MAGAVGDWLEAFGRICRPEPAQAAGTEAGLRRHGDDGVGIGVAEAGKKKLVGVVVQEKRSRSSGVLSDSDTVVSMLMDHFAPA
ncbi:hypothetical protein HU200_067810 [Digitaria exilis]|uniref:Uncharacterized protein n=1 Tax=Digitaria exilis TaxID=1010633 RepID=A0A835DSH8_9POAL|nr:hypothetical protein HU200_067810 [Digitaria exilis]